ncbi:YcxB family protein [Clostridiales bacterium COT073_COT-073]|nr:YcxB family protein [Clostridiales bacterium COT073_COT-073]
MKYDAIIKIVQSNKAIYLFILPAMAIILPLRIFSNGTEKQSVLAFIEGKSKEIKG